MAKIYGTCYCLMEPDTQWVNPYCMESLLENNDNKRANVNYCYLDAHHHTMNWDTDAGPEEGLTRLSTLLCTRGGIISFTWSGQSIESTNEEIGGMEEALNKMTQYLRKEGISQEELSSIIEWVANNCGLTVNDMKKGDFSKDVDEEAYKRSNSYDNQIIAWTYYWNVKIQNEFDTPFTIDPNIVKAMIAQESSFGSEEGDADKNPTRNVMQSLSTGNSTVWVASGINPYHDKMFSEGEKIAFKRLDDKIRKTGDLATDNLPTTYMDKDAFDAYRKAQHYDDFDILKDIFVKGEDGKYMVVFDNVTSDMSIATGIGCLVNKIEDNDGDIRLGVKNYNSKPHYLEDISDHLENMECDRLDKSEGEMKS